MWCGRPFSFADFTAEHNHKHAQLKRYNIPFNLNIATPLLYFSVSLIQPIRSTYPVLVTHVQILGRTQARGSYNLSRILPQTPFKIYSRLPVSDHTGAQHRCLPAPRAVISRTEFS